VSCSGKPHRSDKSSGLLLSCLCLNIKIQYNK
jgi:hypothetical protein